MSGKPGGESWDVHSCPECRLGQLGPGIEWEGRGENPGMSTVVLSVGWDNYDQGMSGKAGGESWDVHSCPECRLGQLGPRIEWAWGEILGCPQLS